MADPCLFGAASDVDLGVAGLARPHLSVWIAIEVVIAICVVLFNWLVLGIEGPTIDDQKWKTKAMRWIWILNVPTYLLIYAVAFTLLPPLSKADHFENYKWQLAFFATLTIAPVVYFFFETVVLFGRKYFEDSGKKDVREYYKATQELASRVWATFQLLLAFYWFHDLK